LSTIAAPPSPYKGLAPFDDSELDALLFFGREREIEVIVANLMAARLTVLYGASGVGKTSLLRAGVAHRLRGAGGAIVVVLSTWTGNPVENLLDAVEAAAGDGSATELSRNGLLADALGAWTRRSEADLYIVLDQFEEYFLYHENEHGPGTLAEELPEALRRSGLRANFLIGIREDSLASLDAFKARIPNLFGNSLRLDRLDRNAARAAILGPLDRYNELVSSEEGVEAEPDLVEAMLTEVAAGRVDLGLSGRGGVDDDDSDRIEAPYLQLVLERLWEVERSRGSKKLSLTTLRELGGAAHIVEDHLERAMAELSPEQKDAAAAMYNQLVTPSGTKIAHRASDLAGYASIGQAETEIVLQRLVEERIVRAGENGTEGPRYEIFHDVLAEAVLAWRAEHEAERKLEAERAAGARRHRRLLALAIGALVLIAILSAIAVYAIVERGDARRQTRAARAGELAARALTTAAVDPEQAVRDALAAVRFERSRTEENVLRSTLRGLRVKAVLPAGGKPVGGVDFSPDGRRLVVAGGDGVARVYRASDGIRLRDLRDGSPLAAAVFSPDGTKIATAGENKTARLWDARTGRLLHVLRHQGAVTDVAFSPRDGRVLATTSEDRTARLWDVATGRLLHRVDHPGGVRSASFSGDGRLLVTTLVPAASDRTARVWDVASGALIERLEQSDPMTVARFAPTGFLVVTAGTGHVARVWDARSGVLVNKFIGHSSGIVDAEFSPSDRQLVTSSTDETARVWDTRTAGLVGVLTNHQNYVLRARFSPDGETVATASRDRIARIFALNGTLRVTLVGHRERVTDVAFSTDGVSVATASADGTARLWDRRPQPDLVPLGAEKSGVGEVVFGADGRNVVSAGKDGSVHVWRLGRPHHPVTTLSPVLGVEAVAISGDGRRVVTAAGVLKVRDVASGRSVSVLRDKGTVRALALSRDGGELAVVGQDGGVHIRNVKTGESSRTIGHDVAAASFSADGGRLVTAGGSDADPVARIWDVRSGRPLRTLVGHRVRLTSASFSPDGRYVVTTSYDHEARVWDARTGRPLRTLSGPFAVVNDAAFSSDGRWVVTAGPAAAGIWDPRSGRQLLFVNGHDHPLAAIAMSPRGWTIAAGGASKGSVKTYDCRLCGNIDDLVAVARQRLARLRH
jgi:WD40 repeat protein